MTDAANRDHLAEQYLAQLPYPPFPVQEEALLTWFTSEQGVLVCAPTGTGKTLIAEAALFEALHTGQTAYYTTPLIALTEQKFQEMQAAAIRWGFKAEDVGLVTGNRRVNPDAPILVVVAEILLNRLLNPAAFDFSRVFAVVVDEFHSFSDRERGIVWELTLGLVPPSVRLLLLSATVGNAAEFVAWLAQSHQRRLDLVQDQTRRVPLSYHWVGDQFLGEQLEIMAAAEQTPALVFCFNREECWTVGEQLKGLDLSPRGNKERLKERLEGFDLTQGVGPKIRQLLLRGIGVHHAGMLPKYRRLVEDLYLRKLLSVCVCTETLAAGMNLPARSVVFTTLMKGPYGKKKIVDASTAHQICGRAGRPQFDDQGFVFAMAHEDDVRILRWQQKYAAIPDTTKDPQLLKAKKQMWKKRPTRRETEQYWNEAQFQKLVAAPASRLSSQGPIPWRLLAYMLKKSPDLEQVRRFVRKRLTDAVGVQNQLRQLELMLRGLHEGGFVTLEPPPPTPESQSDALPPPPASTPPPLLRLAGSAQSSEPPPPPPPAPKYEPLRAIPSPSLDRLLVFRGVHPIYAVFLLEFLGTADARERILLFESLLELPRPILRLVRPPRGEEIVPGPLETGVVDPELIQRGLMIAAVPPSGEPDQQQEEEFEEEESPPLSLADKVRMLFDARFPQIHDVRTSAVWVGGELLTFGGDFNKLVRTRDLTKQEGLVFRHLLRLVLLCAEFSTVVPDGADPAEWRRSLRELAFSWTASCRAVDPESTDKWIADALSADVIEGETAHEPSPAEKSPLPSGETGDWKSEWDRHWELMVDDLAATMQ